MLTEGETHLEFSPEGDRLIASSAGASMAIFRRDVATGALTFGDAACLYDNLELNINLPGKFALDPSGYYLYIPGIASDALAIFDTFYRVFVPAVLK